MSNVTDFISDKLAKAFPRQVVKMPLFGPENIPSPHYGICFDDATEKADWCQCTVKKNYRPHTNEDVRDLVAALEVNRDGGRLGHEDAIHRHGRIVVDVGHGRSASGETEELDRRPLGNDRERDESGVQVE